MLQMRQQAPTSPMGHGFISLARLKAVPMPHDSACASISIAAGSMLFASPTVLLLASRRRAGARACEPV
jgi:hypothetical protein